MATLSHVSCCVTLGVAWLAILHADAQLSATQCRLPMVEGVYCRHSLPGTYFYFDSDVRQCRGFFYNGCGGNGNRFVSREQCERGCAPLIQCSKGEPLTDFAGNFRQCSAARPCPFDHDCLVVTGQPSSICCPKSSSRVVARVWLCDCHSTGRICNLPVAEGNSCGVAPAPHFFYNAQTNICRQFTYRGCSGNDNRFDTRGKCMQFCAASPTCLVGEPWPDSLAIGQPTKCATDGDCVRGHYCSTRGGRTACCPNPHNVCSKEKSVGQPCGQAEHHIVEKRWYFDADRGLCDQFEFAGCGGNLNNFASLEQCVDFCNGQCPTGRLASVNAFTGAPQLCHYPSSVACPVGYECAATSDRAAVCCSTSPRCPTNDQRLFYDQLAAPTPKRCLPEDADSCPFGFECTQSPNKEFVCCSAAIECPFGMSALRDGLGGEPRHCSAGIDGACPREYGCARASRGGRICCRPSQLCIMPFMDPVIAEPRPCAPGEGECPRDTHCLPTPGDAVDDSFTSLRFFCCHHIKMQPCADGSLPYIDPLQVTLRACTLASANSGCPDGFACELFDDASTACCRDKSVAPTDAISEPAPLATTPCHKAIIGPPDWTAVPCSPTPGDISCPSPSECRLAADNHTYCCITISVHDTT